MSLLLSTTVLLAQASEALAPPETARSPGLVDYIRDGGILSYVLIGLSILAVALMILNVFALRLKQFAPPAVMRSLSGLMSEGRIGEAERFCAMPAHRCFVTNVLTEAFDRTRAAGDGAPDFRTTVEDIARGEADEIHRMNDGLGIIAAVGPMLGLLGTVIGMIGAFRAIGGLQGAARSTELASFMSMALVNTAQGLIVAIPATIAFALFRRRIDRMVHRVGRDLERFAANVNEAGGLRNIGSRERAPVGAVREIRT